MKVFIKRLNGTKLEIDVKPDHTIADLKKIAETVLGEIQYPAARQMLIHEGKILKEGTTLTENNVAENDGILIIKSPNKSSSSSAEASTSATTCLDESGSNTSASAPNDLDSLRNSPHFLPLRAMMLSNQRTIEPILAELENQNPELMEDINENNYDFLRLLYAPPDGSGNPLTWNVYSDLDSDSDEDEDHPRNWTSKELSAIGRLEALGFKRDLVSEVFYSCNKDEEAAATFLLSHMKFVD